MSPAFGDGIVSLAALRPLHLPEYSVPYAIYHLARDEELTSHENEEALSNAKDCLQFYLNVFISAKRNTTTTSQSNQESTKTTHDRSVFLYRLLDTLKCYTDADSSGSVAQEKVHDISVGPANANCLAEIVGTVRYWHEYHSNSCTELRTA